MNVPDALLADGAGAEVGGVGRAGVDKGDGTAVVGGGPAAAGTVPWRTGAVVVGVEAVASGRVAVPGDVV